MYASLNGRSRVRLKVWLNSHIFRCRRFTTKSIFFSRVDRKVLMFQAVVIDSRFSRCSVLASLSSTLLSEISTENYQTVKSIEEKTRFEEITNCFLRFVQLLLAHICVWCEWCCWCRTQIDFPPFNVQSSDTEPSKAHRNKIRKAEKMKKRKNKLDKSCYVIQSKFPASVDALPLLTDKEFTFSF